MALRLAEGADLARYKALAGAPLDERRIRNLAEEELLTRTGERIAATPRGRLVLNRIIEALAV
jgi:oxygen-independent coproporphyrinogen-3 oxidase